MSDEIASVAVVISNHDHGAFVSGAVQSALDQRDVAVEVVVVDDGSTDDSRDILAGFADRAVVVEQDNRGQGAAMNAGFEHVTAPIVVFLDADDLLAPDLAQRLREAFVDPEIGRVQFPLALIDGDGRSLGGTMPADPARLARGDVRARLAVHPDDLVWQPTSGNAFRTSVLRRLLPMPVEPYRICADYYLSNLSALHGRVEVLDAAGGSYRVHGSNHHHATVWRLESIRDNIRRTATTNRLLVEHARSIGTVPFPTTTGPLRSVTALANRLVSIRLDPARHPITSDGRFGLVRRGVAAAARREDAGLARRIAMASWFVAMAVVPRPLVRRTARPFVAVEPSRP